MAQPARRIVSPPHDPPVDPTAVDRAYRLHRAKRRARLRQKQERAHARLRFFVMLLLLAGFAIALMLTIWNEIQKVFGL